MIWELHVRKQWISQIQLMVIMSRKLGVKPTEHSDLGFFVVVDIMTNHSSTSHENRRLYLLLVHYCALLRTVHCFASYPGVHTTWCCLTPPITLWFEGCDRCPLMLGLDCEVFINSLIYSRASVFLPTFITQHFSDLKTNYLILFRENMSAVIHLMYTIFFLWFLTILCLLQGFFWVP